MSNVYSAHPALASEQLQRAEIAAATATNRQHQHHHPHRRHNVGNTSCSGCSSTTTTKTTPKKYANRTSNIAAAIAAASTSPDNDCDKSKKYEDNRSLTIDSSVNLPTTITATGLGRTQKTLPVRTTYDAAVDDDNIDEDDDDDDDDDEDDIAVDVTQNVNTKDCVDFANMLTTTTNQQAQPQQQQQDRETMPDNSVDEVDHVQQRLSRNQHNSNNSNTLHRTHQLLAPTTCCHRHHIDIAGTACVSDGCVSGLSSVISSPSPSTASSPLSTPTRLGPHQLQHSHQHCCQKSNTATALHHQQHHHLHHQHLSTAACGGNSGGGGGGIAGVGVVGVSNGCKNKKKLDTRLSPSRFRPLLPIALCILSFATVFATLIVYMDTTEIRHQQFRLNMSRDYELNSVAQDDPELIAFLRQIHMRKYSMHFMKNRDTTPTTSSSSSSSSVGGSAASTTTTAAAKSVAGKSIEQHLNFSAHPDELAPAMAHYVADLVGGKMNGAVIQSLTGSLAQLITAPWLSETLNWMGIIVEPEPRWYFTLRKQNAQRARMQVVHACVSPNTYPKEITIHNDDVRINSLHDEETSWFNSRVKCFPLYTIMLACDRVEYDLLSLGVHGQELEILQTLPFDKVKIDVISIHLIEDHEDVHSYVQSITKFLAGKSYKLQKKFGRNYFYQRLNSMSRTRKKDILLLQTP